jgi:glycosyltransferase involved in cell wall biosynthesis
MGRHPSSERDARGLRLLVTVTFNENQLRAHLLPIVSLAEVESVVLVADRHPEPIPKVRVRVPPAWLRRIVGRAGAKSLLCALLAIRDRPDWVIGFNLMPHGLNAIGAARVARTRSLYEMIGGHLEWQGGGWRSDNALLSRLRRPSATLERILLAAARRSTIVATMGEFGRESLLERGFAPGRVRAIPPAIDVARFTPDDRPEPLFDIVTVGELIARKRTADLIAAVSRILPARPDLRVAIVGEGPLEGELRRLAAELGAAEAVEFCGFRDDVDAVYRATRIFVLTSAYEGLSVAMLEAMASGAVPVVTDVGELGRFVRDGESGRVVPAGDVEALAAALEDLLASPALTASLAAEAVADARRYTAVPVVARTYAEILLAPASA